MLHRRSLLLGAATLAVGGALAGCGGSKPSSTLPADASGDFGFQREGLPITQRPLPLKYSGTKSALAPDFETMQLVQQWKSDTNVDITWNNLPDAVFAEKKNLMLASGDLPDALFNTGLSDAEVVTNGTKQVREIYIFAGVLVLQSLPFLAAVAIAMPESGCRWSTCAASTSPCIAVSIDGAAPPLPCRLITIGAGRPCACSNVAATAIAATPPLSSATPRPSSRRRRPVTARSSSRSTTSLPSPGSSPTGRASSARSAR